MDDRKGGIPAWQRADYKPPAAEESLDTSSIKAENESKNTNAGTSPDSAQQGLRTSLIAAELASTEQESLTSSPTKTSSSPTTRSLQQQPPSQDTVSRPPIITYPEHLSRPQKPPPLVTTSRLLNTAYAFAGVAATLYGVSEYLVKPMTESLTAARHDFHSHSQSKIDELNKRLEAVVSVDPIHGVLKTREAQARDVNTAADTASVDSDPTELFHRDIGTQTAIEDHPQRSLSDNPHEEEPPSTITEAQQRQIEWLRRSATVFAVDSLSSETQTVHEVRTMAGMLREQMEGLAYPATADGGAYGFGSDSIGFSDLYGTNNPNKKPTDEINKWKNEIRGLKGNLLSARNFPAGGVPPGRRELFAAK